MRQTAHSVDPQLLVDRVADGLTLQRDTLERERFATTIMSVLAMVALVLASIGLYGVVSQIVGQRTREIGIRIALGARRAAIAAMVLRDVGAATVAGIGVGVILAAAGTQVLRSRVFGFEEGSPAVLALASGTLGLVAFVAAYAPARRAMRVDPLDALRVE